MIPWYQQGHVNVNSYAHPSYVLASNLFSTELPTTTRSPYFQASNIAPYFQIEAQLFSRLKTQSAEDHHDEQNHDHGNPEHTKPRVFPVERFEPKQDAMILNKAMLGTGTNEAQIIKVITKRSLEQRLVIAEIYKEMFGSDLANDFKKETSGNFRRLLTALMTPLYQFYARELYEAMSGPGTNEDVLIEIFCTLSNPEMDQVKRAYHNMFRGHLEETIREETSGHFKDILISLADRTEDYDVNSLKAKEQARRLHRAGESKLGTDETEFISILSTQSFTQLNEIFFQYQAMTQHDIEDVISSEFSGDLKTALRAIVKVARNKPLYFAERLHNAMKGPGTNEKKIIRIMVTRGELDLGDIAEAFRMKYGIKLGKFIKGDTSGDFQRALLGLLGDPLRPTYTDLNDSLVFEPAEQGGGIMSVMENPKDTEIITSNLASEIITATTRNQKIVKNENIETCKHAKANENIVNHEDTNKNKTKSNLSRTDTKSTSEDCCESPKSSKSSGKFFKSHFSLTRQLKRGNAKKVKIKGNNSKKNLKQYDQSTTTENYKKISYNPPIPTVILNANEYLDF